MDQNNDFLEEEKEDDIYPIDYSPDLVGLGGTFSLIIIWLFLSIILAIFNIISYLSYLGINSDINTLAYVLSIASFFVDIVLSIVILFLIFKYNVLFRFLWVMQTIIGLIFKIVFLSNANIHSHYAYSLIISFAIATASIVYLYQSKRVKNTFVLRKQVKKGQNTFIKKNPGF